MLKFLFYLAITILGFRQLLRFRKKLKTMTPSELYPDENILLLVNNSMPVIFIILILLFFVSINWGMGYIFFKLGDHSFKIILLFLLLLLSCMIPIELYFSQIILTNKRLFYKTFITGYRYKSLFHNEIKEIRAWSSNYIQVLRYKGFHITMLFVWNNYKIKEKMDEIIFSIAQIKEQESKLDKEREKVSIFIVVLSFLSPIVLILYVLFYYLNK